MENKSVSKEFLKDIEQDGNKVDDKIFDDLIDKPTEVVKDEKSTPDEGNEVPKARKYRKLEEKLRSAEDMNIALNERVKALSELKKFEAEHPEVDPDELQVFGTDDKGKLVKSYLDKKFKEAEERGAQKALEEFEARQNELSEQEAQDRETVDNAFEELEETYNINLNNPKTKQEKEFVNGFVDFLENISPKGNDGEIVEYADIPRAFETYAKLQSNTKPRSVSDRQRSAADRSMTESGAPVAPPPQKGPINFKLVDKIFDSFR